jgi:cell division protein FtsQ
MDRRGGIVTVTTGNQPPARPAIDPRIRERRIEVIREAGRRRLRVTLIVASAIVVFGLAYLTVHSPILDVDHIRVAGAQREGVATVVKASGLDKGAPMFWVDTGRIARRIERLPWVARASVVRDFPGTVKITVTEYRPTAYVRVAEDRVALLAATGRVIAFAPEPTPGAIEVKGKETSPRVGSEVISPKVARVALSLPPRLRALVVAVTVGDAPTLTLANGAPEIRLGTLGELRAKGVSALAVLDDVVGRSCEYIDVAAPSAPVSRCND